LAIIKDLSYNGMLICTKYNTNVGTRIEVDMHTNEKVIPFSIVIMSKKPSNHYFHYGVEILNVEKSELVFLKKYLNGLSGIRAYK